MLTQLLLSGLFLKNLEPFLNPDHTVLYTKTGIWILFSQRQNQNLLKKGLCMKCRFGVVLDVVIRY